MNNLSRWWIALLVLVAFGISACGGAPTDNASSLPVTQTVSDEPTALPRQETTKETPTIGSIVAVTESPSETPSKAPQQTPSSTPTPPTPTPTDEPLRLAVTSSAFESGALIPDRYARSGDNLSPPITWSDPPAGTESYAILFVGDPVADGGGTWILWALYNLPGDIQSLPEGLMPDDEGLLELGGEHLENSYLELAYSGPPTHPIETRRFYLRLYALDTVLDAADIEAAAATVNTWIGGTELILLKAMEGHVLATGQLSGKYKGESPVG